MKKGLLTIAACFGFAGGFSFLYKAYIVIGKSVQMNSIDFTITGVLFAVIGGLIVLGK